MNMATTQLGARARVALGLALVSVFIGTAAWAGTPGKPLPGSLGTRETTAEIAARQAASPAKGPRPEHELEYPDRSVLPQNPEALAISRFPEAEPDKAVEPGARKIHTTGASFDGGTLTDTGAFPPDTMGTAGPTQFVVFLNGLIRSFTKAGVADGVLNANPDVFFASVMTPVGGTVVLDFTSDPQIRYDRFTGRWFMSIIDVPCTNATCTTTTANRWMVAVSDAASNGTITGSTVWTFFQFQTDPGTNFCDYPSLGVDVNALYVGCDMFSSAGSFVGTNGYVIRKSSILGAGPLAVTMFANLAAGTGSGPFAPRGVDNLDPAATEGYFIGVDNATFSTLMFRRVSNPGSASPTISSNISVTVPTTTFPNPVTHLGNTGGNNGRLDSLDDRLYAATARNGRLWTAHNFRVDATGVANTGTAARNATRWYELQNLTTTPTLVQSGTVFDNASTLAAARQYWIPSVTVTGQGHAVLGMSMAGTPAGATPVYVGRLSGDTAGLMTGPPSAPAVAFGTTAASYNPASDTGGSSGRRWGDYSFTAVDPLDEMTVWTIQEYNQASGSYAVRVGKLAAPPPATPACSGSPISFSGPTGNVVITATSSGGSGFYDPGTNLTPPALPFNHISATVTNATVNSVTYNSPTQVALNITALVAGLQNVTITNPDGQSVTANGCINVSAGAGTPDLSLTKSDGGSSVAPGGTVAYTLTYANGGTAGATGVVITETVPASSTFNAGASTAGWSCTPNNNAGSTCTLAIGSVAASGGSTATFAVTAVNPLPAGVTQLSNTASIADDGTHGADSNPANNTGSDTTPVTGAPDLSLTKSDGGASAAPGGGISYTLTYANSGNRGASGVVITETVPANTTFNSGASTAGWSCTPDNSAGSTCTLTIGTLAAGGGNQTATFAVTVVNPVPAGVTQISNTASIADNGTNGTDSNPANNTSSDTTPVTGAQPFTDYYSVQPCRVLDTRVGGSGGPLISGVPRVFTVTGLCTIPADAVAISINLAVVTPPANGFVTLYPGNGSAPVASTINFHLGGFTLSNNAFVQLATDGAGTVGAQSQVSGGGGVDLVIDVVGYFK